MATRRSAGALPATLDKSSSGTTSSTPSGGAYSPGKPAKLGVDLLEG